MELGGDQGFLNHQLPVPPAFLRHLLCAGHWARPGERNEQDNTGLAEPAQRGTGGEEGKREACHGTGDRPSTAVALL